MLNAYKVRLTLLTSDLLCCSPCMQIRMFASLYCHIVLYSKAGNFLTKYIVGYVIRLKYITQISEEKKPDTKHHGYINAF